MSISYPVPQYVRDSSLEDDKFYTFLSFSPESRIVLPGKFVPSAIKYATRKYARHSGNIDLVVSMVTTRRTYNFEFLEFSDMKEFYSMAEAVFHVPFTWE